MARRVLLVDDQPLLRSGLRILFAAPDWVVEGEVGTLRESQALLASASVAPDLAIIDVLLSDDSGLALVRDLAERGVACVVLSAGASGSVVRQALSEGALGFVAKSAQPAILLEAVDAALHGRRYLCPASELALDESHATALTPRETEVLRLIASGLPNKEIAVLLQIAPRTVETHRERLMSKLGAHNAADLTREALRRGY